MLRFKRSLVLILLAVVEGEGFILFLNGCGSFFPFSMQGCSKFFRFWLRPRDVVEFLTSLYSAAAALFVGVLRDLKGLMRLFSSEVIVDLLLALVVLNFEDESLRIRGVSFLNVI